MTNKERELFTQALKLITELDKEGLVLEMGLILEMRAALAQPEHLSLRDEAKRFALMQGGGGAGGRGWFDGLGSGCDIWKLK